MNQTDFRLWGLTTRTTNCLACEGLRTVEKVAECSAAELLRIPNLGRTSLAEVEQFLAERGLTLRGGPTRPTPAEKEARERATLARLKAKYETDSQ